MHYFTPPLLKIHIRLVEEGFYWPEMGLFHLTTNLKQNKKTKQ